MYVPYSTWEQNSEQIGYILLASFSATLSAMVTEDTYYRSHACANEYAKRVPTSARFGLPTVDLHLTQKHFGQECQSQIQRNNKRISHILIRLTDYSSHGSH